jgi:hypothetical protein
LLGWEDDELEKAITARLAELQKGAEAEAAKKKEEAAKAEAQAKENAEKERLAALRKEVETAFGAQLGNYDATLDQQVRAALKDSSKKLALVSGCFFNAVATAASDKTPAQVLGLLTDQVSLEAFIYGNNSAKLGASAIAATSVADALAASQAWTAMQDAETVIPNLRLICAHITAGRIVPIKHLYRKATPTSTAGFIYYFERPDSKRGRAQAEWHLHPGRASDTNNAGFKNRDARYDSGRVATSSLVINQLKAAIKARGLWYE